MIHNFKEGLGQDYWRAGQTGNLEGSEEASYYFMSKIRGGKKNNYMITDSGALSKW